MLEGLLIFATHLNQANTILTLEECKNPVIFTIALKAK